MNLRCANGTRGGARRDLCALGRAQFSNERAYARNSALSCFYERTAHNETICELLDLAHMRCGADAEAKHQGQSARSRTNAGNETCEVGRQVLACARYPGYRD